MEIGWWSAKLQGEKRYQPSHPCKYGHLSPRYVSNNGCVECGKTGVPKKKDKLTDLQTAMKGRIEAKRIRDINALGREIEKLRRQRNKLMRKNA